MKSSQQAQKLASLLLEYLRTTNQSTLPPHLVRDLQVAASQEDESNTIMVTSALELDSSDKAAVKSFVEKRVGKGRKISYNLDTNLIAGFTIKIGDELVDASVATKLALLKDHLGVQG